jgi:hypothetical protein
LPAKIITTGGGGGGGGGGVVNVGVKKVCVETPGQGMTAQSTGTIGGVTFVETRLDTVFPAVLPFTVKIEFVA